MKAALSTLNSLTKASVLLAFFVLIPTDLAAQQKTKSVPSKRLAVDVVSVRKVGRLLGIVLDQNQQSVSMVVRRDWLKKTYPEFWKQQLAAEAKEIESGREKIETRLNEWRNQYSGDDALAIGEFIDANKKLIERDQSIDVSKLAFTIVNLDRKRVGRVQTQSADKHRIAGVAWSENLADVESTNARVLQRSLKAKQIDIEAYPLKLGNEMVPVLDSDQQWAARKALVEFGLLTRVEFQGSGTTFFQRGKTMNAAEAMKAVVGVGGIGGFSQIEKLGQELGLPEFQNRSKEADENETLAPMIKAAKDANRRSFSVSLLEQGQTVTVKTKLYIQAIDGRWYPMGEFTNSEKLADQNSDEIDHIKQDPQIDKMIRMMNQFGASVDPSIMDKAMRSGVATKKALDKSMEQLDRFVDQYCHEIDYPPVSNPRSK